MTYRKSPFRRPHKPVENRIDAKAGGAQTLYIYDEISWWGVNAEDFVKELNKSDAEEIHIRINSPGGAVFDGTSIYNAIKRHKSKTVIHIDGLAASIASVIAMAGDEVRMSENAFFMIHEPWSVVIGDSQMMRDEADLLDKVSGTILNTYTKKTGKTDDEIKSWMQAETWFTAQEAKDAGFIDLIDDDQEQKAKASLFDLSVYANVPEELKEVKTKPAAKDLERILRDAGCSRKEARAILAKGLSGYLCDADDPTDATPCDAEPDPPKPIDKATELLVRAEKMAPKTR